MKTRPCRCGPRKARGFAGQRDRREEEQRARVAAVQFALWVKRQYEVSIPEAARRLRISVATLREWLRSFKKNGLALPVLARGRPVRDSDLETRKAANAIFDLLGPGIGVPTLRFLFPSMAKRELDDLVTQYAKAQFDGKRTLVHALSWLKLGAVWAMDYTAPPNVIEGRYRTILAVRDLASGKLLAAVPAEADDARTTCEVLRALFAEHGAPLVLKSDNGPHFIAAEVTRLLRELGVVHLRSPYYTPSFNGSIEAGIGSLKIRAHFEAARHDRPGEWTLDDVEAARLRGNELGFPNGLARGTPDAAWKQRVPVTEPERRELAHVISRCALAELGQRGYEEGSPLGEETRRSIERVAITRALSQLGFVQFRRRFIPLPISPGLRSRIA